MCTVFFEKPELHIATEDIEVVKFCYGTEKTWRLFRGKCLITYSRYLDKVYITGKTYRNFLEEPIHYYTNIWKSCRGLYSYDPNTIQEKVDNEYVFRGIIPKRAHYYYDKINGVYISDKLKLIA